jgi:hypothetical protein
LPLCWGKRLTLGTPIRWKSRVIARAKPSIDLLPTNEYRSNENPAEY